MYSFLVSVFFFYTDSQVSNISIDIFLHSSFGCIPKYLLSLFIAIIIETSTLFFTGDRRSQSAVLGQWAGHLLQLGNYGMVRRQTWTLSAFLDMYRQPGTGTCRGGDRCTKRNGYLSTLTDNFDSVIYWQFTLGQIEETMWLDAPN